MKKQVQIGNHVAHLEDNIKGRVIRIEKNIICLEDEDGFTREYPIKELIVYDEQLAQDKSIIRKDILKITKVDTPPTPNVNVIDLHHHNSKVNPNRILDTQLRKFQLQLNTAIRLKKPSIIFIHGVGEGVLQRNMEQLLRKNKIHFAEASFSKYGYGAMEVFLKGVKVLK